MKKMTGYGCKNGDGYTYYMERRGGEKEMILRNFAEDLRKTLEFLQQ